MIDKVISELTPIGEPLTGNELFPLWGGGSQNISLNKIKDFVKSKIFTGTSSQFIKADGSVDSTAYLPKSGGAIKRDSTITPLLIDSNNDNGTALAVQNKGISKTIVGFSSYRGSYFENYTINKYISIKDDGTFEYDNKKIWHEGNDGSGSGLDADLLDGWHRDDIRNRVYGFERIAGVSANGGYDLNTLLQNGGMTGQYGSGSYWANAPVGMGYGSAICFRPYNYEDLWGMLAWDVNHAEANGNLTRNLWWRAYGTKAGGANGWGQWKMIAFTDSNVASANKLTTKQLTNENLNTIKDVNFSNYQAGYNNTCSNKPSGVGEFNLVVTRSGNYYHQTLINYDGLCFKRTFNPNNSVWSAWKKMLTEDDLTDIKNRLTALENK